VATSKSECNARSGVRKSNADATELMQMPEHMSNSQVMVTVRSKSMIAELQPDAMLVASVRDLRLLGLGLCLRHLNMWRLTTHSKIAMHTDAKQMAGGMNAVLIVAALTRGFENNWARGPKTRKTKTP
jgi:hypothetical protein